MDDVRALGQDVFELDTRMGGYDGITASYLIRAARPALVETGAALAADRVAEALERLGVGADDLSWIVVTHIHLDHAGGVGDLAAAFPRAQVVVQEQGARHLADPTRLMASAQRVFGPVLDALFGRLRPTEPERIAAIGETGRVDLGEGRYLEAFHNPGHATHHLGLLDSATGDLYTGDAAGIYIPETADVRPATPPPDFDLDLALDSLARMRSAQPNRLLFSHFGPVSDVEPTLERSADELRLWVDLVRTARQQGLDTDHAVALVQDRTRDRYRALAADPAVREKFDVLAAPKANVLGIWRWLEREDRPA